MAFGTAGSRGLGLLCTGSSGLTRQFLTVTGLVFAIDFADLLLRKDVSLGEGSGLDLSVREF